MKKSVLLVLILSVCWWRGTLLFAEPTPVDGQPKDIKLSSKDLGTPENPIKCKNAHEQVEYLRLLRDKKGKPVRYERIGHGYSNQQGRILDKYRIISANGKRFVIIYMDMYHRGSKEIRPVKGFKMASVKSGASPASSSSQPSAPKARKTPPATRKKKQKQPLKIHGFDDIPDPPSPPPKQKKQTESPKQSQTIKIAGFDDVPDATPRGSNTGPSTRNPGGPRLYLSVIPIAEKKKPDSNPPPISQLANNAVEDALKHMKDHMDAKLFVNHKGHTFKDDPRKLKRFASICVSGDTLKQKKTKIINEIMEPSKVGLVVTVTYKYVKESKRHIVTPIIASRPDAKLLLSREISFTSLEVQTRFKEELRKKIIEILEKECPKAKKTKPPDSFYVTFIPLPPPVKKQKKRELPELLDIAIKKGITKICRSHPQWSFNSPNHSIHTDSQTIKKLRTIISDVNMSESEVHRKIVDDIMISGGIDCLVLTRLTEMKSSGVIQVQPCVIGLNSSQILKINLIFQRQSLICNSTGSTGNAICQNAAENIEQAFQTLIEQALAANKGSSKQ